MRNHGINRREVGTTERTEYTEGFDVNFDTHWYHEPRQVGRASSRAVRRMIRRRAARGYARPTWTERSVHGKFPRQFDAGWDYERTGQHQNPTIILGRSMLGVGCWMFTWALNVECRMLNVDEHSTLNIQRSTPKATLIPGSWKADPSSASLLPHIGIRLDFHQDLGRDQFADFHHARCRADVTEELAVG